jgi:hypothetical protein
VTRRHCLPAGRAALLALAAGVAFSLPLAAAEPQVRAEVATDTSEGDAPGRSSVPAPAFARAPRLAQRTDFSSQSMAFELRFGPYLPRVDDGVAPLPEGSACPGRKPDACVFGDKTRYQFGFEVDGQFWRAPHVGTLGLGIGWSYTRRSGANKLPGGETSDVPIAQESTLSIMPMYAVGVLRVDVLARELHIPLVGYGKFGLGYALWWANNGRGTAKVGCDDNGKNCFTGKDTSVGTQAALGAMFLLDWLEPSSGAELDDAMGINNSYLFLEWSVSNFGGNQMNVGTNTWVTGLAVEM